MASIKSLEDLKTQGSQDTHESVLTLRQWKLVTVIRAINDSVNVKGRPDFCPE